MNYYKDTTDYIPGYNPIINRDVIADNHQDDITDDMLNDCINCLMDNEILANCPFIDCPLHV